VSRVAAIARSVGSRSSEMGFSQKTCFPAAAACSIIGAWYGVGAAITTASMLESLSTSS